MVSAANALAAEAGREMLRAGGSAIDAAIATQLVLNIVEPQSSGLGGGAFILYWDKAKCRAEGLRRPRNGAGVGAPRPLSRRRQADAVRRRRAVGAEHRRPRPRAPAGDVHKQHGKLPWAKLFEPAIRIAEQWLRDLAAAVFSAAPRRRRRASCRRRGATSSPTAAARCPIGHRLKNPEFAATLRAIAAGGADAFYEGPIAQAIVDAVAAAPIAPGGMTLDDLKSYTVKERAPLCATYRGTRFAASGRRRRAARPWRRR